MTAPPPRTRTVGEVAAPYENFLLPVPAAAADVCGVCHSMTGPGYPTCYQCQEAKRALGTAVADATAFVSLAPRGEQLARELLSYKDSRLRAPQRNRMVTGLAAVLFRWLGRHEQCLANPLALERFDILTTVPSTSGRADHPLRRIVSGVVAGSDRRHQDLLAVGRTDLDQRGQAADRYAATRELTGQAVLVIDDTWTTGAHAQSASAALKARGAAQVGVVAIGRWVNPGYRDGAGWLAEHRKPGWSWETCCLRP